MENKKTTQKKPVPLLKWQLPMKRVLYALSPLVVASVALYGWRSLAILTVVTIFGFLSEYMFARHYKDPVSSSVFVSTTLFYLTLPPSIPLWIAAVGIVFGIVFGKMVFGGFGKTVFNPALVGRAFIYVSFGKFMTATQSWYLPAKNFYEGFLCWSRPVLDATTGATPMKALKFTEQFETPSYLHMFLGNTSGCLGETSALLILIGGLWLLKTKTANKDIVLGTFIGYMGLHTILWLMHATPKAEPGVVATMANPLGALISGGFLFGLFFMVTDPVTACKTPKGKYIYGALIGILTCLIRTFASWPEGFMFAVLLGNMFAPIIDHCVNELKKKKSAKKAA